MRRYTAALCFSALLFTGCSDMMGPSLSSSRNTPVTYEKPTPAKEAKFHEAMIKVAQSTRTNPNYNRMALNTPEEKEWFKNLMYRLWDRQITRQQFIAEGLAKYPNHKYEFEYIANAYQNY
jgi:hypothetical protein